MKNIILNEVSLEHVDTKVVAVPNIKIGTRESFQHLYSETFYSLYPNLLFELGGMLLSDDIFAKHSSGTNSLKVKYNNEMQMKNDKWDVTNLLSSSELPLIDQISLYFENEWEIYEIFHNNLTGRN